MFFCIWINDIPLSYFVSLIAGLECKVPKLISSIILRCDFTINYRAIYSNVSRRQWQIPWIFPYYYVSNLESVLLMLMLLVQWENELISITSKGYAGEGIRLDKSLRFNCICFVCEIHVEIQRNLVFILSSKTFFTVFLVGAECVLEKLFLLRPPLLSSLQIFISLLLSILSTWLFHSFLLLFMHLATSSTPHLCFMHLLVYPSLNVISNIFLSILISFVFSFCFVFWYLI